MYSFHVKKAMIYGVGVGLGIGKRRFFLLCIRLHAGHCGRRVLSSVRRRRCETTGGHHELSRGIIGYRQPEELDDLSRFLQRSFALKRPHLKADDSPPFQKLYKLPHLLEIHQHRRDLFRWFDQGNLLLNRHGSITRLVPLETEQISGDTDLQMGLFPLMRHPEEGQGLEEGRARHQRRRCGWKLESAFPNKRDRLGDTQAKEGQVSAFY